MYLLLRDSSPKAGEAEYKRLVGEVEPFLDSVVRTVTLINRDLE